METNKWEGKRSINEAEEEEDEHESVEEDSKRKRVLTLSGRKLAGEGSAHPSCQVDQCTANMADAKPYHRRHKVCEFHSKSPIVLISGLQQRFCQQCSRFPSIGVYHFLMSRGNTELLMRIFNCSHDEVQISSVSRV
ncbi:squamosa promoter-binding protein 1 isoform X1 [Solanum tuberosum]|uniref:squamosa promoter-binding protein 1 isoform X1 n=1 Tax=Solanum tuberosum TaxID=4113 RepID=UPI0003D288FD|nr:PREDICTED: squamosa promoter-binding protein 1 isoform X1 [Solanum tuberosum]